MTTLTDTEFLDAFLACRLEPTQFDHRAHVRAGWLVLQRHELEAAIEILCDCIHRLATQFGAADNYNRTLTEAIVRLMASGNAATLSWPAFISSNTELMSDARKLVARHYSPELLRSTDAKTRFMPPDRAPLPPCPTHRLQR